MNVAEAQEYVLSELSRIEKANLGKELRPWACNGTPESMEHWGLIQQKIALDQSNPHLAPCCRDLDLHTPVLVRSAAQQAHDLVLAARRTRPANQVAV